MAAKKDTTPKKLRILELDPSLGAFEGDINARMERYQNKKKELLGKGKKLSELMDDIRRECADAYMEEQAYTLREDVKAQLQHLLFEEKALPDMKPYEIDHVSYMDGCKIYLKGGGWVIARFSGTEPLLRVFGEMPEKEQAKQVCACFKAMIDQLGEQ